MEITSPFFTTTHLLLAFGVGMVVGAVLAALFTLAFWNALFRSFVAELTQGLAQMVNAKCQSDGWADAPGSTYNGFPIDAKARGATQELQRKKEKQA
jgi:type IV secretory pathway VirB6-like protein